MQSRPIWTALLLCGFASIALAQGRPRPKIEAEKSPLEAKLIAKTDSYKLAADQSGKDFAEKLKAPDRKELPEPPKVDLVLELKNPTDKPVTVVLDSDAGALDLVLEGPGAVTVEGRKIFTREFRIGKEKVIEPGKTLELPITSLKFGFRGVAQHAYWTEPGEYKIAAVLRWPDPAAAAGGGRKVWQAAAEPVKVEVK
jgi:hypothetical protein